MPIDKAELLAALSDPDVRAAMLEVVWGTMFKYVREAPRDADKVHLTGEMRFGEMRFADEARTPVRADVDIAAIKADVMTAVRDDMKHGEAGIIIDQRAKGMRT